MAEHGLSPADKQWIVDEVEEQIEKFKKWVRDEVREQLNKRG